MGNMKIIFGGSFNPPTIGHYAIAKYLIEKFEPKVFLFMPTGNVYHKKELIDISYRIEMLNIICKKLKNASVSDFEARQNKYYGTFYTLQEYPGYYFVMGADNLLDVHNWINYPQVIIENKYIILNRDHINLDKIFRENELLRKYKDNFIIITDFKEIYVSSSEYRHNKNEKVLLEEIVQYIKEKGLYK